MVKKGDTLIEVTLAVGIFSMVAIAVVAVMSNGTSNSQNALETTLAREEINVQAEALRFIHSSYVANKDVADSRYAALWGKITSYALDVKNLNESTQNTIFKFTPHDCSALYTNSTSSYDNIFTQHAFIINPRGLNDFNPSNVEEKAIFFAHRKGSKFSATQTYPRLVFGTSGNPENIVSSSFSENLDKAEGIYVVAVKDNKTTNIVNQNKGNINDTVKASAFYDFYIRTCWYGNNAEEPSTISTVIRLYDPDAT